MNNKSKVYWVSFSLRSLFTIIFIWLPIPALLAYIYPQALDFLGLIIRLDQTKYLNNWPLLNNICLIAITFLPIIIEMIVCFKFIQLFKQCERHKFFLNKNIIIIKTIAILIILKEVFGLFFYREIRFTYLFNNPLFFGPENFILDQSSIFNIILALIILLASWFVKEAYILKKEHQLTI